jgi:hypothetical protein
MGASVWGGACAVLPGRRALVHVARLATGLWLVGPSAARTKAGQTDSESEPLALGARRATPPRIASCVAGKVPAFVKPGRCALRVRQTAGGGRRRGDACARPP